MTVQDNIVEQPYQVSLKDRNQLNQHGSLVLWFTGLSGSGKSTIANAVEKELFRKGIRTYSLDGDNIRRGLNKGLTFSEEDRRENIRRIAEVGKLFKDAGLVTLTAFISPLIKDRQMAREIIGPDDFLEVFINTPLEVCEERDVKGLYQKARAGDIINFTGLDAPYESPENPVIEIETQKISVEEAVDKILQVLIPKIEIK